MGKFMLPGNTKEPELPVLAIVGVTRLADSGAIVMATLSVPVFNKLT
jgi:hypothetical protein